jgi:homoserine dehydrogenase
LRILLVGFGTVGQALATLLIKERDWLVKNFGFEPQVTAIVDSQGSCRDDNGLDLSLALKTKVKSGTVRNYPGKGRRETLGSSLISDTEAETMIETTPSNFKNGEPGLSNIKRALSSKKHVVTTNKGPLAIAMAALLELARYRSLQLRFSGTVGAGTPFLSFASKCLPGEKIIGIQGILNGTTNYILTRMEDSSLNFQDALKEAQKKGYAETDPRNDVDGLDTAAKLVIIANWVMKQKISLRDVEVTGISGTTTESIKRARTAESRIRLIGRVTDSKASVKPEQVPRDNPICVPDTLNALTFTTEHVRDVTLIGRGAGGEETASAVLRDLVDIRSGYSI